MPNENQRTCPQTYDELETVKQSIIKCKDITDNANYDDVYRYHPGGQLRLDFDKKSTKNIFAIQIMKHRRSVLILRIKTALGSVHHSLQWQMML